MTRRPAARFAFAACFAALFFAGASFTAGAGDQAARLLDDDAAALAEVGEIEASREAAAAAAQPVPEVSVEAAPVVEVTEQEPVVAAEPGAAQATAESAPVAPSEAAAADAALEPQAAPEVVEASRLVAPVPTEVPAAVVVPVAAPVDSRPSAPAPVKPTATKPRTKQWVVERAAAPAPAPEIEHAHGEPTVWLNRALPDPTPASARLARSFAVELVRVSKRHGADWAVVLGVLRAQGERGSVPAGRAQLEALASRLGGEAPFKAALAVSGRTSFADRAVALADLYRSVGIEALVTGFEAAKARLAKKLLADEHLLIYQSGREDIAAGRIDVRVIVLLGYLAERHDSVTVSSLFSGHRRFARPGVVSAHVFGHAVDIAAVGGRAIAGNQQPGGLTEAAVRSVLLLPAELQPQQVISLLGLGGPSFPLHDHGDHIHVGF